MTVGEEFHATLELHTGGQEVTLLRIRPVGIMGRVEVGATLMRTPGTNGGTFRGPLPPGFEAVRLPHRVSGHIRTPDTFLIDLALRPAAAGEARVAGVEVRYKAGFLRTRTAFLPGGVCLLASGNWRADIGRSCDAPGRRLAGN